MTFKIRVYGDPVLKKKTEHIKEMTPELRRFIKDLSETMYSSSDGIGLAAPQVGESLRITVIDVDHINSEGKQSKKNLHVFINPEIEWESEGDVSYTEGCLSIPGVQGKVYRPESVKVRYRDKDFNEKIIEADGLLARCLQHEIDHLEGVLFVDRMSFANRAIIAGKLSRLRKLSRQGIDAEQLVKSMQ